MGDNIYTLYIYPRAQADMDDIFSYISNELCNPDAAVALMDEMEEALNRVCQNPLICPRVSSTMIKDSTLRKLLVKNYIIFYRPVKQKEEIQVVRVLYGMMDYEKML